MIRPIRFITSSFISFFGITEPTPQQQRQAELFITGLLVLIIVMAAAVFSILVFGFGRSS
jgi:hypothetical protein